MAALLSVVRPVPAVIRRRAKELLDAIRNAVKQALTPADVGGGGATSTERSPSAIVVDDKKMIVEPASPPVSATTASSLWSGSELSSFVRSNLKCSLSYSIIYNGIVFDSLRAIAAA